MKNGDPYAMRNKLKAKFVDVGYSRQLDLIADYQDLKLEGTVAEMVASISTMRSECAAAGVKLSENDLKAKLLRKLPADLVVFGYQQKDATHANEDFSTLAQRIISFENGTKATAASSAPALYVRFSNCAKCNRPHSPKSVCWGTMSDAEYAKRLAAHRKKTKDIKSRKSTVASVATVESLDMDNNKSYDYYSKSVAPVLTATTTNSRNRNSWVADSGCGKHMTKRRLQPTRKSHVTVKCANGEQLKASGRVDLGGALMDVLVVNGLSHDLMSVGQVCDDGPSDTKVMFTRDACSILCGESVVASGIREAGIYSFQDSELLKVNLRTGNPVHERSLSCLQTSVTESEREQTLLWHERLGHLGFMGLAEIVAAGAASGIPAAVTKAAVELLVSDHMCDGCIKGKSHRVPVRAHKHIRATRPFQLVHTDVMGPFPVPSRTGSRYVVTFVDDFSKHIWVEFMQFKSEVFGKTREFFLKHTTSNCKVDGVVWGCDLKQLRSDNGGEYRSKRMTRFCKRMGITQQFSEPYTPEQNGAAERMNRTLLEMTRCELKHGHLAHEFWAHAYHTAAYIRNRCLSRTGDQVKTPYELLTGEVPDLSGLRVFGCVCYVYAHSERRAKLDDTAFVCRLLGYEVNGYRVWNPATGRIFVTREVVRWDESRFSLTEGDMEITWDPNTEWQMPDIDRMDDCVENPNEIPPLEHGDENSAVPEVTDVAGDLDELPSVPSVPNMLPNMTDAPVMDDVSGVDDVVSVADVPIVGDAPSVGDAPVVEGVTHVPVVVPSVPIGADLDVGNIVKSSGPCPVVSNARVTRSRVKSVVNVNHMSMAEFEVAIRDHKLKCESTRKSQDSVDSGVHVSSLTENNFVHPGNVINQQADTLEVANGGSSTGAKCCSSRPLFVEHNISSDSDIQNLIDILSLSARIKQDDRIPTSLAAAKKSEHWSYWKEAIESELRSLEKHKTWISAPKVVSDGNARGNVVGSKWVFDLKLDKYGNILRYKARLVAQGFSQVEGVDYKETFAPVANRTTLRLVMSLAATMDLELQQMEYALLFLMRHFLKANKCL